MSDEPARFLKTILVVDDNLQNREVAEGHLQAAGYMTALAESGERALALFQERRPDLVLLDVLMPGMDGFETCRRLRALPGGPETPIVFLTALGDLATHKAALDSGADDFLSKPINRTELLIRIRSLLRIKELSSELQRNYEVIRSQRDALLVAEQHKRELTALIVHDLKNPLSSILSTAEFLVGSEAVVESEREALSDVLRASQTMLRMVMNLLDVSRSEDGALVPRRERFQLPPLLAEIESQMGHRVSDKSQRIQLLVAPTVQTIDADPDLIRRVLENLVDNAYKYGPRCGTITIDVFRPAEAEGVLEIRVRDEGLGIPPEHRTRIFEKYARVETAASPELRNGHGLGLAFCRLAVQAHGGEIWVEDNAPRGSCFCIRLPVREEPGQAAA